MQHLCTFFPTTYLYDIMYDGSYSSKKYSEPVCSLSWSQLGPVVSGGSVPCHEVQRVSWGKFKMRCCRIQVCHNCMKECFLSFFTEFKYCWKDWICPTWISFIIWYPEICIPLSSPLLSLTQKHTRTYQHTYHHLSSGMWYPVAWLTCTNVSEMSTAAIIRVQIQDNNIYLTECWHDFLNLLSVSSDHHFYHLLLFPGNKTYQTNNNFYIFVFSMALVNRQFMYETKYNFSNLLLTITDWDHPI